MIPSQNDGVAMPAIANTRTIWSIQLFCRSADMAPSGMAIRMAMTVAMTAISSDIGRRSRDFVATGLPDHIEVPKSSVAVAPQEIEELHDQRIVEAELLAGRARRRGIDVRAARSQAHDADVARDQAHQHEYQRGRSRQVGITSSTRLMM